MNHRIKGTTPATRIVDLVDPVLFGWAISDSRREYQERLNRKFRLIDRIAECAEDNRIAINESGMDCDCNQYSGNITLIEATPEAYHAHEDERSEWADGPFNLYIMKPSEAEKTRYQSRDLIAEAHEDGHPWVVYA